MVVTTVGRCENRFCIYWEKDDTCWLDEIELTPLGSCFSCILLNVPEEELDEARARANR